MAELWWTSQLFSINHTKEFPNFATSGLSSILNKSSPAGFWFNKTKKNILATSNTALLYHIWIFCFCRASQHICWDKPVFKNSLLPTDEQFRKLGNQENVWFCVIQFYAVFCLDKFYRSHVEMEKKIEIFRLSLFLSLPMLPTRKWFESPA